MIVDVSCVRYEVCSLKDNKFVRIEFDKNIRNGTIGQQEGKVFCKAFRYAIHKKLPVVVYINSAGIRVNEGTKALMQMARMVIDVQKHSKKGLLFISVIIEQSLGGLSASIVPLSDIIIMERNAVYGFTGKRIVEKTIQKPLPKDFQKAEYARRHGMVDLICSRNELDDVLIKLLELHSHRKTK